MKPVEHEKKKDSVIVMPAAVKERQHMLESDARVLEVGAFAWHDEPAPRAVVGDLVILAAYSGYLRKGRDGEMYRVVNGRDIFAVIDEEQPNE